jgi:hypothetical protein
MSRAEASLTAVLAAMPDASPFLIPRPGDAELPATVILDRAWLAGQLRLRGQIWGTGDQRTLSTLWWYSASAMLVRPSLLALAADGTCLSPRLEHIVIHHQPAAGSAARTAPRRCPATTSAPMPPHSGHRRYRHRPAPALRAKAPAAVGDRGRGRFGWLLGWRDRHDGGGTCRKPAGTRTLSWDRLARAGDSQRKSV